MAAGGVERRGSKSRTRTGKIRLRSLDELDGRTAAAQRAFELRRDIVSDISGGAGEDTLPSTLRIAAVNAALLAAMAEDAGTRWIQGEEVSPNDLATIVNALNRTCSILGYKRLAKDAVPSLSEYSQRRAAELNAEQPPVEEAEIVIEADAVDPDAEPTPEPVTASQAANAASDLASYLAAKGSGQ